MCNSNLVMDKVAILEGYNVSLKLSDISRLLLQLVSPASVQRRYCSANVNTQSCANAKLTITFWQIPQKQLLPIMLFNLHLFANSD